MAVGDVNLARQVGERISAEGPQVPFEQVKQYFDEADLVLANLECSLSMAGEEWPGKEIHLVAPERAVESITFAGIDVVSVANNHSLDYGREGLVGTLGILDLSGIDHAGGGVDYASAHAPVIIELNGLRLAILSYVVPFSSKLGFNTKAWAAQTDLPGVAIGTPEVVRVDIAAAKHLADVVIVVVHSGGEFRRYPKNNQLALAEAAIDAGAALVHWKWPAQPPGLRARKEHARRIQPGQLRL